MQSFMKKMKLILLGDFHYSENKNHTDTDIKDHSMPQALLDNLNQKPLQKVVRHLARNELTACNALMFCGDLANKGVEDTYRECLDYIKNNFDLGNNTRWSSGQIYIVPGNHDIFPGALDPTGSDLSKKIQPLINSWNGIGRSGIISAGVRQDAVPAIAGGEVSFFSINSCLGCREKKFLPNKTRDQLIKLIDEITATKTEPEAFDAINEILDAPAINAGDIDQVHDQIKKLTDKQMPIILGHHNILPQPKLRVTMYGELLNSGKARSMFSDSQRTVLYCHGHIHDTLVEIVKSADQKSTLVCISAPEIIKGYVKIFIHFSSQGFPVGCEVYDCILQSSGVVEEKRLLSLPLVGRNFINKLTPLALSVYRHASAQNEVSFLILLDHFAAQGATEEQLESAIIEGHWAGLIKVLDREEDRRHWRVKKIEP